ncbi:MAG TPA: DNA repair protein RecO [Gemmatimonas sp.]|nr:DNA repair protein RecO [Gemmatimonas sp.]
MSLLVTDAIVLHSADYLESSRIFRLATREAGVQSVLARGARSSRKRFGSALGLFAEGHAQIATKPGRDLHTLLSFDVVKVRPGLAADLGRFTASSALAESVLRIVHEEAAPQVYDGIVSGLDAIAAADSANTTSVALGVLWRLVSDVGFTPSMEECSECHERIPDDGDVMFSHHAGGVVCMRCGVRTPGGRRLPASARRRIVSWLASASKAVELTDGEQRAHRRLLREFLSHHLPDARAMRAYLVWEQGAWGG